MPKIIISSCTRVGYTSEASVHWVSQDDPSLLIDLSILLLDIPCNVLYTLCGAEGRGRKVAGSTGREGEEDCTHLLPATLE